MSDGRANILTTDCWCTSFKMILASVLFLMCVSLSSTVKILQWPPLSCSQQGLECTIKISNCLDSSWLYVNKYTPSSPEELQVSVDTREDTKGHLQPILLANWKLKDDGSIRYLNATELHVLVTSTNQNLCVRYSFKDELPMRSPAQEKWFFSANMLVIDPGQRYRVSVFNIPKPEVNHSGYDISTDVIVPDCEDHTMQKTQYCIERGSLWRPNISVAQLTVDGGKSVLAVGFSPDRLCEEYIVIVSCFTSQHVAHTYKTNQTTLNVTFSLDKWPRSCCQFDVQIKPLFPQCGQDCTRRRRSLNICPVQTTAVPLYPFVILVGVFMSVVMAVVIGVICRKQVKDQSGVDAKHEGGEKLQQEQLNQAPKVLIIYSQDHHLYRDIVLKLCAFLQAKCCTKVLVDLLDSASVSMVGRIRWLEWQRQKLKNPYDKILVLCSRGVQAKWRAICGQGRVTLREDVLSPTDDMLIPFLNLFLPDMYQAGMLGKYIVAYFEDISNEQDIPSVFDIAVKYKLMKHFEELYFRIQGIEKYQPGQVNHIEGIGADEYFNCPSGKALKNAIETFQAYQLEHPDWFEKECVDNEEEVMMEANVLSDQLQIPSVQECVPLIRDGLPVYIHDVEISENVSNVHVLTPKLNTEHELTSVAELTPVVKTECSHHCPSNLDEVLTDHRPSPESVFIVEPILSKPPHQRQNWLSLKQESLGQIPTEDEEEDCVLPLSQLSTHTDERSSVLHNCMDSDPPNSSFGSTQSECFPLSEISHSQPEKMGKYEFLQPSAKGQSSGSDQGYISKMSSEHEPPFKEDPVVALRMLQEELLQRNLRYYDLGPEGN